MYTTNLPQYDIINGHPQPTPWWCYKITPLGYDWPTYWPTLDLAIAHVNKVGGEVRAIDPDTFPPFKTPFPAAPKADTVDA